MKVFIAGNSAVSFSTKLVKLQKAVMRNWELYLIFIPVLAYFIIFQYAPMYGIQIAFKDFIASKGILNSPWVGFEHFERFFKSYAFGRVLSNTVTISFFQLAISFPAPIILALLLNEVRSRSFKKTVQMITYAPHFLSVVVLVGMLTAFLSPRTGIVNTLRQSMGLEAVQYMTQPEWFKPIYVLSGVWQNCGWNSIIYIAAIAGVSQELYEAATVDGASRLQKIMHVTIPGIMPTAVILLILNLGQIMNVGFEKVFLMQNDMNRSAADVIATYVYDVGLIASDFSFAAAVGLFNSVVNFALLVTVNAISKRISEISLW